MITGKNEELQDMAANNVCAADGGHLTVAWDSKASLYYLRCGICDVTTGIHRVLSPTEEHKAGAELPPAVKNSVERGMSRQRQKESRRIGPITMGGIPATDLGTGELLTIEVLKALVDYAHRYGLDPRRGHVCLMYGEPYIQLDGYLFHANQTKTPYSLESRPLTAEEKPLYLVEETDHAWLGAVTLLETGATFTGIGVVTRQEMEEMSRKNPGSLANPVLHEKPWQMCQKRAEWQVMKRAFPIGEPPQGEER